jgi:hypothetical protein
MNGELTNKGSGKGRRLTMTMSSTTPILHRPSISLHKASSPFFVSGRDTTRWELTVMRSALVSYKAIDAKVGFSAINAKAVTISTNLDLNKSGIPQSVEIPPLHGSFRLV